MFYGCRDSASGTVVLDPLNDEISVLRLERVSGSDLDVVNSARVSHAKQVSEMSEKDNKLISYLSDHDHGTPFEHNQLVFEVKAPIFVFREWHRHRVGWSYNEWSMRYLEGGKDVEIQCYLPGKLRKQATSNRQASGESFSDDTLKTTMLASYYAAVSSYDKLIKGGVAREIARSVLPVGMYSAMWASCNLRSLMHFLKLRLSDDAQWEIRQYAKAMLKLAEPHFPVSIGKWRRTHGYNEEGEKG
jgi:thymidylate synthase (FAD)